jgi:hypothetical protein
MDNFLAQGEARCEFCAAGDEFDFAAVSPPISNVDFKIDTSDPTPDYAIFETPINRLGDCQRLRTSV